MERAQRHGCGRQGCDVAKARVGAMARGGLDELYSMFWSVRSLWTCAVQV